MRHYKKVTIPEKKETLLDKVTCDLCGAVAKAGRWESSVYEVAESEIEVTVRQADGENYPEGGAGTKYVVDMCPNCFKTKLIPWLEAQGCTAKREEWEW
jgi:hypothetical protein